MEYGERERKREYKTKSQFSHASLLKVITSREREREVSIHEEKRISLILTYYKTFSKRFEESSR